MTGLWVGKTLVSVMLCPWASDRPMAAESHPAAGSSSLGAAVRRQKDTEQRGPWTLDEART